MPQDVIGSVGQEARAARDWMIRGGRSGLNQIKSGGWGGLFGMGHLKAIQGINRDFGAWGAAHLKKHGGVEKVRKMSAAKMDKFTKMANKQALGAAKEIGRELFRWGTGHGYTGFGRAGAIGARAGLAWGAMQVADFLNPFGFLSIRD